MSFNLIISIIVGLFCSFPTHAMLRSATINYPGLTAVNPHVPLSLNGYMYYPRSMYLGGFLLAAVERDLPNEVQDLAQQTDLNTSNLTGDTSLHRAADLGRLEMVKILLRAGANMHLVNQSGQRPIDCALIRGHQEVVHLLQAAELCAATIRADTTSISALVVAGADVNKTDQWGLAPLHYASMYGHTHLIPLFLRARANLEVPNSSSSSRPLHIAIEYEQTEMVRALLKAGAEIQAITSAGETPLHRAALKNSRKEIVQVLLDAGADTGNLDYAGNTPLMSATNARSSEIIPLLEKKRITTASMIKAILSDRNSKSSLLVGDLHTMINDMLIVNAIGEAVQALKTTGAVTEEVANDILSNTGKTLNESAKCLLKEQAHTHSYSRQ